MRVIIFLFIIFSAPHDASAPSIDGMIPIEYRDGLLLARGELADGTAGYFIVDFGSGGSVIGRRYLPDGVTVERVTGREYIGRAELEVEVTMAGAGGTVGGFIGRALLPGIRFGDVGFEQVPINIIKEMPDYKSDKIIGILGLDLLRRARLVSFEYRVGEAGSLVMISGETSWKPEGRTVRIPFTLVSNNIFIDGYLNGRSVRFVFDTGAPRSIISSRLARRGGLETGRSPKTFFRGLDGRKIVGRLVETDRLKLGGASFKGVWFFSADLPAFEAMGLRDSGALLGNDFLDDYERIDIDFGVSEIRLWK